MSEKNSADNVRRSRRIAAKSDHDRPQLLDMVLDDLERDSLPRKKNDLNSSKRKLYKSKLGRSEGGSSDSGTLFEQGLQAISIVGATSIDDEESGTSELCYLVKYENGQFELVMNKVAHKYCPMLVIDFLEPRILFKDKENFDLSHELLGDSLNISQVPESQLSQIEHTNRSMEI